jgi:quercetin dioxygenase-like cupin family protein
VNSEGASYTFLENVSAEGDVPENSILSRTLHQDDRLKILLFAFAPGQELSAHTAPMPAVIHILEGEATLTLGGDKREAGPGTLVHMPPRLEHGIQARTKTRMLLFLLKQG